MGTTTEKKAAPALPAQPRFVIDFSFYADYVTELHEPLDVMFQVYAQHCQPGVHTEEHASVCHFYEYMKRELRKLDAEQNEMYSKIRRVAHRLISE